VSGADRAAARERIAARAAREIAPGDLVNLGIGLPTEVARFLPRDGSVLVHAENGIVGMGPEAAPGEEDPDRIDAGGRYVTVVPGAAYLDSVTSFALVRSGRVTVAVLGAFEVDAGGDLANWRVPGRAAPGVGGGMELAQRVPRVVVTTLHRDRNGGPKLVRRCTLPLTARACVTTIVTELAVLEPAGDRFRLRELAPGVTLDEVRAATGAELDASDVRPWSVAADDAAATTDDA
jgi:3-oxoacid CoA-transferase B subunit